MEDAQDGKKVAHKKVEETNEKSASTESNESPRRHRRVADEK